VRQKISGESYSRINLMQFTFESAHFPSTLTLYKSHCKESQWSGLINILSALIELL